MEPLTELGSHIAHESRQARAGETTAHSEWRKISAVWCQGETASKQGRAKLLASRITLAATTLDAVRALIVMDKSARAGQLACPRPAIEGCQRAHSRGAQGRGGDVRETFFPALLRARS